jgi:hypothetical protein
MESFPGRVTRDDARRLAETLVEPAKRGRKKQEI